MIHMDEKMRFSVYCTELFRTRHALSGDQVMNLFRVYGVLDYLTSATVLFTSWAQIASSTIWNRS